MAPTQRRGPKARGRAQPADPPGAPLPQDVRSPEPSPDTEPAVVSGPPGINFPLPSQEETALAPPESQLERETKEMMRDVLGYEPTSFGDLMGGLFSLIQGEQTKQAQAKAEADAFRSEVIARLENIAQGIWVMDQNVRAVYKQHSPITVTKEPPKGG